MKLQMSANDSKADIEPTLRFKASCMPFPTRRQVVKC